MVALRRSAAGLASLCLTGCLCLGFLLFLLFDSDSGRQFVREQTEGVIDGVLGPDYRAELGRQAVDIGPGGELRLRWDGVQVYRSGVEQPQVAIRTIAVGFDGLSLLRGRIQARTLEIAGADIDVTSDPASAEVAATARGLAPTDGSAEVKPVSASPVTQNLLPAMTSRLLGQAERQLGSLGRLGIRQVDISDVRLVAPVAPGGGPFVSRIEHLGLDVENARAMSLSGVLALDRAHVPVEASIGFDAQAQRLRFARIDIGKIELGELLPPSPIDDMKTEKGFATDAPVELAVEVSERPGDERRHMRVAVALDEGQIQEGRGHAQFKSLALALDYIEGEDRLTIGPNRFTGDGFEFAFAGGLTPVYDAPEGGAFNGFELDLASTRFRSSIGARDGQVREGVLKLDGRTDLANRSIRLNQFEFSSGGGRIGGSAQIGYGSPDARIDLDLGAAALDAPTVKAFWPFNVAVGARRWVLNNVGDEGSVTSGEVGMHVLQSRMKESRKLGASLQPGELDVRFVLDGLTAKSFGQLPDLLDAKGVVEVRGGDTLVSVESAKVEGRSDVAVEGGLISFTRAQNPNSQQSDVKIVANFGGKLSGLAALAAFPPLSVADRLPFRVGDAGGTGKVVADIDLLIGDDVPDADLLQDWKVSLNIADGALGDPIGGRKLNGINGSLAVNGKTAEGNFTASYGGAKGEVSFKRALTEAAPDGRRMEANLRIDGGEAAKLAPVLDDVLTGPVSAKLVESGDTIYRADLDLTGASLTLPWIGWRKGIGVGAGLAFSIPGRDDDRDTDIDDIVLKGEGFSVNGRAEVDGKGLILADFGKVAFNPGDEVQASVKRVENGYTMAIKGDQFDARPLLADIRDDIGAKTSTPPKRGSEQIDVSAAVGRVIGFGKETVSGFALNYAGSGSQIAALSISGRTKGSTPFAIDVSPRGKDRAIDLRAEDVGALIGFTGAYDRMQGGKLSLSVVGSYDDDYVGKVTVKDFALVDEPRLSSLVAAPPTPDSKSLSQAVGRDLRAERAVFDHASAGLRFGKDGMNLSDGIVRGPVFGSSFAGKLYDTQNRIDITGSFMPAYGLNRVFGAIPIVGQILGNGREGGLIGITYKLSGAFASPKLEINPISAIAPGIFRNIFAYQ
ncbi:hypothetical protein [Aureimonas psammosilenae]|uniref:hypothetical protein n=1 Tax=Aureimonas psammosilenae TaxID=2495496 RepID=UPI001260D676|nr:hypothetical protein [Aureimonas psammosilenae]